MNKSLKARWFLRRFLPRPEISVIMPIFNKGPFIQESLDSVLGQEGVTFEIICVDDGSNDGSLEIVRARMDHDKRILLVENSQNLGPGPARNIGIRAARGDYLQFMDADDWLLPNALQTLLEALKRTKSDVVRGGAQRCRQGVIYPAQGQVFEKEASGNLHELREIWIPWYHTCYLINRRFLKSINCFYPEVRVGEDPVFISRVNSSARNICLIPDIVYTHRVRESRPPLTSSEIKDYIKHASLVRRNYLPDYRECWHHYRDFICKDIEANIKRSELSEGDLKECETALAKSKILRNELGGFETP